MEGIATFCDYFVIATGTSATHIRAVADGIQESLKKLGVRQHHIEGYREAVWVVVDYGSVVVHVFEENARQFYDLERLWADAPRVDYAQP